MQKTDLVNAIKSTLQKTKVEKLTLIAAKSDFSVHELIDLTFNRDEKIAFRAAWILENLYMHHLHRFIPALHYFLDRFPDQENLSARRHYCKILALITDKKVDDAVKNIFDAYPKDRLIETSFNWLVEEQTPVAIKCHCLNILADLCEKQNWIREELLQTINFLIDKESIAFYARAKQIRKQLLK